MPLWHIYCPEERIRRRTSDRSPTGSPICTPSTALPRFLVSVVFQEVPKDSYLIGGEPADDFVASRSTRSPRVPDDARGWWMKRIRETSPLT